MPAMPITLCRSNPLTLYATYVMTSSGLETTIRIAWGDLATTASVTPFTIPALVSWSCSRVMPGFRAIPAVMTTMFDPAVSSYELEPRTRASVPLIGADSYMSRPFPCGSPSTMSTSTTSLASSLSTMRCATVAPTFPAPTTVIFIVQSFKWCECFPGNPRSERCPRTRALRSHDVRPALGRGDAYHFGRLPVPAERDDAFLQRIERVVAADADVDARREPGAALADQNASGGHFFPAKPLYSETLRIAVASVA